MIFHPSAPCICLFIHSITVQEIYCIQLSPPLSLACSTRRQSPGPYVLVCSVHWSVHQSIHLPQSLLPLISPAGRCPALLHCTHPSLPPSICLSGLCKGQRRQRDIGWLMLLSSLTFLSLVRTHLHTEPWFFRCSMNGDLWSDLQ